MDSQNNRGISSKIVWKLWCILSIVLLTACGRQQEQQPTQGESVWDEQYFFEVTSSILADSNLVSEIASVENSIYYYSYNDTDPQGYVFYCKDYDTEETQKIAISSPEGYSIYHMAVGGDRQIYCLYLRGEDGNQEYLLEKYGEDGKQLLSSDVTDIIAENDLTYVSYFEVSQQGQCVIVDGNRVLVLSDRGKYVNSFELPERANASGNGVDGSVMLQYLSTTGYRLVEVNSSGKKGEEYAVNACALGIHSITGMDYHRIGLTTRSGYQEYNIAADTLTEKLTWLQFGISDTSIVYASALSNGTVILLHASYEELQHELLESYFTRGESSASPVAGDSQEGKIDPATGKQILTLGSLWRGVFDSSIVSSFNAYSDEYIVQLKIYHDDTESDVDAAVARMNAEIVAGKGPDMLLTTSYNYYSLMKNGAFEDLYPYMEADETFHREEYFDNILTAYDFQDSLYAIVYEYGIGMMTSKKEFVGENRTPTIEEIYEIAENTPNLKYFLRTGDNDALLGYFLIASYSELVDLEQGKCYFDSEEFIRILNFCKEYGNSERANDYKSYQTGETLFFEHLHLTPWVYSVFQLVYDNDTAVMGYPRSQGSGYLIHDTAVSMMSTSRNKEGVWEFIRFALSEQNQHVANAFSATEYPVLISAYEQMLADIYTEDTIEDSQGLSIVVPKMTTGLGDVTYEIYALPEGSFDFMTDIIRSATDVSTIDQNVREIIIEEAEAYFNGMRTAEEVAALIQNRVQIYVSEMM